MSRVILIAWDGADWRILDPLLEQGALPNLQALIDQGNETMLRSTVPTHSWSAWPSFLTGVDPVDHGVYDILETVPGTHKQYPVTYKSIKARTFLDDLTAARRSSCCSTCRHSRRRDRGKPRRRRGAAQEPPVHDAGRHARAAAEGRARVADQRHELDDYHNKPDAYLDEAFEVTGKRIKASEWLMDSTDWDLMATVWVSIDTQHALSNYVADHPDYATNKDTRIGKKVADIFVDRRRDRLVREPGSRRRPHPVHQRSRVPVVHANRRHGPPAEGSATSSSRPATVFGPMQWGPMRKVARKVYDVLGLHGKISLPQSVNWQKTRAFTTIRSTGEGVARTSRAATSTARSIPATTRRCATN